MSPNFPRTAAEIRKSFLDFFVEKAHTYVPSAPVVPQDDPTLMFTNAGMNQFKGIFLGDNPRQLKRAVNSQKCIRVSGKHNDLDEVGRDTYHHTLFEMLGNWSFGDYYKEEAIAWAWELLTERWGLAKDRLFVTVYKDDDEAADIWAKVSGLPADRIMRFGNKENFWEMGDTGPCGPCSEIHYDKGDIETQMATFQDPIKGVNGENDRYIEIWNNVFIQYNRNADGSLVPLKAKSVDTGMGFERICAIMQNVHSNYDTDVFTPIITKIAELSGVAYQQGIEGMPHRVIADHLRAVSFSIADGVMPGNEGRGYVIRRILRRASRYARNIGCQEAFIYQLVDTLADFMGDAFPEIRQRADFVKQVIQSEEERFIKTLGGGLERFEGIAEETVREGKKIVDGRQVFVLYDTYGFPVDLTRILAEEKGLGIDEEGFTVAMNEQKERARSARKISVDMGDESGWVSLSEGTGTEFLGYESSVADVNIRRYRLEEDGIYFVADRTPFYAESGGQVGEKGRFINEDVELEILDTTKINDMWIHKAQVAKGLPEKAAMAKTFKAEVVLEERADTRKNHSATHLLHAALREVLGDHVNQQGSRVDSKELRFDFSHFQGMTDEEIKKVEQLVNAQVQANLNVATSIKNIEEAKAAGAMALFGEKYGDEVRVVQMGQFSVELCGGLHVSNTGEIGLFKITSESSVAAGVRRITAVSGGEAFNLISELEETVAGVQNLVRCKPSQIIERVQALVEKNKDLEKEISRLQELLANQKIEGMKNSAKLVAGVPVIIEGFKGIDKTEFAKWIESLAAQFEGIAVLTNTENENGSLAVTVAKSLTSKIKAGDLVRELAALAGGKGGGRPDRAQAGTREPEKLALVLESASKLVEAKLG